jgi:hypothetical protein
MFAADDAKGPGNCPGLLPFGDRIFEFRGWAKSADDGHGLTGCEKSSRWGRKDVPQGLKPTCSQSFTARPKSCPDTKQSFPQAVQLCDTNWGRWGFGVCVRTRFPDSVPQGRLNLAQDVSPGFHSKHVGSPAGTAEGYPKLHQGYFQPSLRDWFVFSKATQD